MTLEFTLLPAAEPKFVGITGTAGRHRGAHAVSNSVKMAMPYSCGFSHVRNYYGFFVSNSNSSEGSSRRLHSVTSERGHCSESPRARRRLYSALQQKDSNKGYLRCHQPYYIWCRVRGIIPRIIAGP